MGRPVRQALRRVLAMLVLVSAPWSGAFALDLAEARHLVARTGFGATVAEVERLLPLSREAAIDLLLSEAALEPSTPLPAWADDNPMLVRRLDDPGERAALVAREGPLLKAWWVGEMLNTPSPLTERMTLLWHGHFTSGLAKVESVQLMLRQNLMLRRHALGSFRALLGDVLHDPAMLIYLDNDTNVRGNPNENLARELMELFTLGIGNYSEADVREAARALTGLTVQQATGDVLFVAARHDEGDKTVLGRTGPWSADDLVDILLATPRTAEFVVGKLWAAFVVAELPDEVRDDLAELLRQRDYEIAPVVRVILLSDAFWAADERGAMITPPPAFAIGTLRLIGGGDMVPPVTVARLSANLGQDLFDPPDVAGWPDGEAWITPSTLSARYRALERLIAGPPDAGEGDDTPSGRRSGALVRWLAELPFAWRDQQRLRQVVLPALAPEDGEAPVGLTPDPQVLAGAVRDWLLDPTYHLR